MPRSAVFGEVIGKEEYLELAAAADYHNDASPSPLRKAAKSFVELDRLAVHAYSYPCPYRIIDALSLSTSSAAHPAVLSYIRRWQSTRHIPTACG